MEKRQLGTSNIFVSSLGLGCMSLGTEEKNAREIIELALENGINYFDTADLYDHGFNEKIVGQALKGVREEVIIATKVGNRWREDGSGWCWDASKAYIKEAVKKSLNRLNTDYIDLYQLHGGTMEDPIDETIEAFEELKSEGFIREYGISSIRPTVISEFARKSKIVSVMMQYSLLDRRPEEQALPLLESNQISIVARGPLAKGLVSDALLTKASASIQEKGYLEYSYKELQEILPVIKDKLSNRHSMTAVSLQYVLSHPTVASAVAGVSSPMQLKENIRAVNQAPLTKEEMTFLQQITKTNRYEAHRID